MPPPSQDADTEAKQAPMGIEAERIEAAMRAHADPAGLRPTLNRSNLPFLREYCSNCWGIDTTLDSNRAKRLAARFRQLPTAPEWCTDREGKRCWGLTGARQQLPGGGSDETGERDMALPAW